MDPTVSGGRQGAASSCRFASIARESVVSEQRKTSASADQPSGLGGWGSPEGWPPEREARTASLPSRATRPKPSPAVEGSARNHEQAVGGRTPRRSLPGLFGVLLLLAGALNAAGYYLNLWERIDYFDEFAHAVTSCALVAALAWVLLLPRAGSGGPAKPVFLLSVALSGLRWASPGKSSNGRRASSAAGGIRRWTL